MASWSPSSPAAIERLIDGGVSRFFLDLTATGLGKARRLIVSLQGAMLTEMSDLNSKRWFHSKLRIFLLVVATLLAIDLAWQAVRFPQAQRQQEAAREIKKLGGQVIWWAEAIGEPGYQKVLAAELTGPQITDAALEHLQYLHGLRSVDLSNSAITDGGLETLCQIDSLDSIDLTGTKVTDSGVRKFREKRPNCAVIRRK